MSRDPFAAKWMSKETKQALREAVREMDPEALARANASARTRGAVGARAIVPRVVEGLLAITPDARVLDFGAGPAAIHAVALRAKFPGAMVVAHEIGANVRRGVHDPAALDHTYDVVYASNVLNVLPDYAEIAGVLAALRAVAREGGRVVFNFPLKPNYGPSLSVDEIRAAALERFEVVEDVWIGGRRARAWVCA